MNADDRLAIIRAIHDSPLRIVLAVTGGGMLALSDLLTTPGGSRTVLEATVPYSVASLYELMGAELEPHVSDAAALAMAEGCLSRAQHLLAASATGRQQLPLAGVACTAALATDPPRRGTDRAHIAAVCGDGARIARQVTFNTNDDRVGQDRRTSDALLGLLAEAAAR
ncbi:hypothetical protein [Candidatus Poriferisodalis sp.]|uniref:hypothetical protein n=1 Tax=Candidatus Poriferisodalis sp. TaxID=3101277 RepID=UPI003B0157C6